MTINRKFNSYLGAASPFHSPYQEGFRIRRHLQIRYVNNAYLSSIFKGMQPIHCLILNGTIYMYTNINEGLFRRLRRSRWPWRPSRTTSCPRPTTPKGATPSPSSWFYFDIYMATSSKGGALEQYLGLAPLQVAEGSEAGLTQANLNISA